MNSIRQIQFTIDFVEAMNLDVKWHGRAEGEAAHYCNVCEVKIRYFVCHDGVSPST